MKTDGVVTIALFVSVLAVLPQMKCQLRPRPMPLPLPLPPPAPPRPLCASQFALVNYACSMLPYNPAPNVPPPSPPSPDSPPSPPDDDESLQRQGHRHRHRHRHGRVHEETPEEESCCRWLKAVDNECVCDLLVHLPVFLARPVHAYTVIVDESCNVTYACSGRLRP